jgi:hypothetical protein
MYAKLTVVEQLALTAVLQAEAQLQRDFLKLSEDKEAIARSIEERLDLEEGSLSESFKINTDTWELEKVEEIANGKPDFPPVNPSNKSLGKKKKT